MLGSYHDDPGWDGWESTYGWCCYREGSHLEQARVRTEAKGFLELVDFEVLLCDGDSAASPPMVEFLVNPLPESAGTLELDELLHDQIKSPLTVVTMLPESNPP